VPPKILYAHGFGSGPQSAKGRAVEAHLAARGIDVALLDLRVPSPSRLRLSAMVEVVLHAIGEAPSVLAIGSSLGGLTVAHAAARDPRIVRTLLLAPAFRLEERWRARMGDEAFARWETEGTATFEDATGAAIEVDFGFVTDAADVERATEDGFPALVVPTTIVHGQRDETVDPGLSRSFATLRPAVRLVEVDDDHQLLSSVDVILRELDALLDPQCADSSRAR
jgi:pimeloyl-ACP methyl ester carboxylesterase